jgi:hypothetical protein
MKVKLAAEVLKHRAAAGLHTLVSEDRKYFTVFSHIKNIFQILTAGSN